MPIDEWNDRVIMERTGSRTEQILDTIGFMIEGDAKRLTPVDTGRLRASIAHIVVQQRNTLAVRVGTSVHYAAYVELGTVKMAARPYLRPALETNKAKARLMLGVK